MKNQTNSIACSEIHKQVKAFLDDLLVEQEYQTFVNHIMDCQRCHRHVRSIGALSNHIWDLSEVKLPQDLRDALLFELSQNCEVQPGVGPRHWNKWAWGGIFFAAVVLSAIAVFYYQEEKGARIPHRVSSVGSDEEIVSTDNISEAKAKVIYEQLQDMANTLGVSTENPAKEMIPVPAESSINLPPPSASLENPAISQRYYLHWHVRFSEADFRTSLHKILSVGNIPILYESPDLLVIKVDYKHMIYLRDEIVEQSREASPIQNFSSGIALTETSAIYLALYFEDKTLPHSNHHWHLRFRFNNRDLLIRALTDSAVKFQYQSPSLIVVALIESQLPVLIDKIREIPELTADFEGDERLAELSKNKETLVSLFLF